MELLVHLSAPTTRKDDERYKAQVLAYEDFECSNRVCVTSRTAEDLGEKDEILHIADNPMQDGSTTHLSSFQRPRDETEIASSNKSLPERHRLPEEGDV